MYLDVTRPKDDSKNWVWTGVEMGWQDEAVVSRWRAEAARERLYSGPQPEHAKHNLESQASSLPIDERAQYYGTTYFGCHLANKMLDYRVADLEESQQGGNDLLSRILKFEKVLGDLQTGELTDRQRWVFDRIQMELEWWEKFLDDDDKRGICLCGRRVASCSGERAGKCKCKPWPGARKSEGICWIRDRAQYLAPFYFYCCVGSMGLIWSPVAHEMIQEHAPTLAAVMSWMAMGSQSTQEVDE